jgi:hypothetical protein
MTERGRPRGICQQGQLLIENGGAAFEIGTFLTAEQRGALAPLLERLVGRMGETPALEMTSRGN